MNSHPILHRLSIVLAACTLILLIAGAFIAGSGSPLGTAAGNSPWLGVHKYAAGAVGALALVTLVALFRSTAPKWLKAIGLGCLTTLGATAVLGWLPRGPATGIAHAVLSHVLFALVVLLSLGTSSAWNRDAAPLEDRGWPSLRSLAWLTPAAVLLQIALGAGYRYQAISAMPHAGWAFPVMLMILMLAAFTLTSATAEEQADLRKGSIALMTLVFVQLILGVVAFLARMDPPLSFLRGDSMAAVRATHLGMGALVFGFTVALAAQILRCAVPAVSATPQSTVNWPENGHGNGTGNGRRG
jgi:heme A synthase